MVCLQLYGCHVREIAVMPTGQLPRRKQGHLRLLLWHHQRAGRASTSIWQHMSDLMLRVAQTKRYTCHEGVCMAFCVGARLGQRMCSSSDHLKCYIKESALPAKDACLRQGRGAWQKGVQGCSAQLNPSHFMFCTTTSHWFSSKW